ncbi:adenosine deaminase [Novosphingobium huizhouense]|uniref:adenosine deaminase n=1 Tax=Novosphingobium huizhouense TaxID=2866625 RepID=UPI001CD91750|nr:adenosine deaminase [Novosphingobium huizhouense]
MKLTRRDIIGGAAALGGMALGGVVAGGRAMAQAAQAVAPASASPAPFALAPLPVPATPEALDMARFIRVMPKAEYHVHLEGTLEAEMKFRLAQRNGITLPFADAEALKASYQYHDLPSFLAIYYDGMQVLVTEQDFHDLALAYLARAASQNVLHTEMFFDPQEHLKRGVTMGTVILGITRAREEAARLYGISSGLILCFVRDLDPHTAMEALDAALPYRQHLVGVGLDSDEKGHPPGKFAAHFAKARAAGLRVTVHCDVDQENSLAHIRQAIVDLKVDRIDHGGNILQSAELVALARQRGIAFTVCPSFSGTVRAGGQDIDVVRGMLDAGLKLTIASDDPAYMGSEYLSEVLLRAQQRSRLTKADLLQISRNAIEAAWLGEDHKTRMRARLDIFERAWA